MAKRSAAPSSVLFDLDGTLLDTAPDFIRCLNLLRQEEGLAALPDTAIRDSVSDGARAMIQVGFGLTPEDADYTRLHSAFLDRYEASVAEQTVLFPGMAAVLEWLEAERIPWGIVTNKPARFTTPLLEALSMSARCAAVICPDHVSQRKPHPESILLACKQIGVPASTGVYVGDHLRDIEAGRNAGMITIAARYGYIRDRQAVASWGADHIVDSADALLGWLVQ